MKRFAFFPGCLIPTRHPAMEFAIRETIQNLGIEIVDLEGASCCPDPIYFKSRDKMPAELVAYIEALCAPAIRRRSAIGTRSADWIERWNKEVGH